MRSRKKSSGFTIVELLMGMIASSIIALAVGSVLYFTWVGWRNNREAVTMQRDAMVAMRIIEHRIRNARFDDINGWGSGTITFGSEPDFLEAEIAPDTDVLLQYFDVQPNGLGGVTVSMELETSRGGDYDYYEMTVYPRN